jgi:hypothetical protein
MFLTLPRKRTLILWLAFFVFVPSTFACLCEGGSRKAAFNRARKNATVIFVGRAVDVHNGITRGEFDGWRVKLAVEQYWKGQVANEMIIFTAGGCAAYFEVGRDYLVFAYIHRGEDHLSTDVCMQTGLVRYSSYNLKRLGRGKKPTATTGRNITNRWTRAAGACFST